MNCVKYWAELVAAIVTIFSFPLAFYVFGIERLDRFHDQWVRVFRDDFASGNVDTHILNFRSAIQEASRPWRSTNKVLDLVIAAAMEGLSQLHWQPEDSRKEVKKYLVLAMKEIDADREIKESIKGNTKSPFVITWRLGSDRGFRAALTVATNFLNYIQLLISLDLISNLRLSKHRGSILCSCS